MQILENKNEFRQALISWYQAEKRDLPWRKTSNPYYIWVSEVMLQQTRVDTVIPYYERFITKYPTMKMLASADENELLKMWEGLGYYSRAKNLQIGVQEVVEKYGSKVPSTRQEISTLKGVGPYTAGAILSIAYGVPEHAVDGNVMRVISRLLLIKEDIAVARNRKIFEHIVTELMDSTDPSSFNQGLMELGATICTPKPRCLLCPVRDFCTAFHEGMQEELPVKTKQTKRKIITVASFAIENEQGEWLIGQRPEKGLLANLWEFPMVEIESGQSPLQAFAEQYGVELEDSTEIISFKHVFSHITWQMTGFQARFKKIGSVPKGFQYFSKQEIEALPMPVPVLKIWKELKNVY